MNTKIKIVLVCHQFYNQHIVDEIKWSWRGRGHDVAVWNRLLVEGLEKHSDIELHVIAPMCHMKKLRQVFFAGKTHYYFYKPDVPFFNVSWRHFGQLDAKTNFWWARRCVQGWIRDINPDIINLIGAENPNYSASILGLRGYPIFISMQSVYSNPDRFKIVKEDKIRSRFERKVISENIYFGINAPFMPDLIRRDVKKPILMWNRFPTPSGIKERFVISEKNAPKYDFVQYSRLTELKGAPDTIRATAIVKKFFPNIRVRMMGGITSSYLSEMKELILKQGLEENIVISQGFARHSDLMKEACKARFYILPTKVDTIPTTIFEATNLGLPIVSYKTGDIPKLNLGCERVLLAERFDVEGLARQMLLLMREPDIGFRLNRRMREFVDKYFSNETNVEQHICICRAVIDNYRKGVPIPQELMYEDFLERKLNMHKCE